MSAGGLVSIAAFVLSAFVSVSVFGIPWRERQVTRLLSPFLLVVSAGCVIGLLAAVVGLRRGRGVAVRIVGLLLNAALLASTWFMQPSWSD